MIEKIELIGGPLDGGKILHADIPSVVFVSMIYSKNKCIAWSRVQCVDFIYMYVMMEDDTIKYRYVPIEGVK